jgi:hypothetical protein
MDSGTVRAQLRSSATPDRSQIVRAKLLILEALGGGPLALSELEARHRKSEGAKPSPSALQLGGGSTEELGRLLHSEVSGLRAQFAVEWALAELVSAGMVLALAPLEMSRAAPRDITIAVTVASSMVATTEPVDVDPDRPLLLGARFGLAAGVGGAQAWQFDVDGLLSGLDVLSLDARTRRCAAEAFSAYVRGAFLATASLLGAVVEGAWYGAAERRRLTVPELASPLDRDQTAQVQKLLCAHYRKAVKRAWRVDDLERDAGLFREIRNYGVHPRGSVSTDVERHLHEDTCGLLITVARGHLVTLAEIDGEST